MHELVPKDLEDRYVQHGKFKKQTYFRTIHILLSRVMRLTFFNKVVMPKKICVLHNDLTLQSFVLIPI